MSLIKWNPSKELLNMEKEFNRIFNFFGDRYNLLRKSGFEEELNNASWMPLADISEDENNYFINLDLPGMLKEEIKISYSNGVVSINGERSVKDEVKDKTCHTIERAYGKFYRSFTLPAQIESERINANYENGQLSLILPKAEESKPKQIEISVN